MQRVERLGARPVAGVSGAALAVFVTTILTSAFLLFALEPMFTKMLLPLFGGSPEVWNTAIVFFQFTLLAGYAYAHVLRTRLSPRYQALVHCAVVGAAALTLPIHVPAWNGDPTKHPILALLAMAALGVGLPFFVLAANSSLVQAWFARTAPGEDPYVLYAASNLGSMAALVSYPFVIEPYLGLALQTKLWTFTYLVLMAQLVVSAYIMTRVSALGAEDSVFTTAANVIPARMIARWVILAAVPSSLMLGATSFFEDRVAAIPLLWTLPLGLYLATFVVAFGLPRFVSRRKLARAIPFAVAVLLFMIVNNGSVVITLAIAFHLIVFGMIALYCHATLRAERPSPARLTDFYLWIAVGGALGGTFNALIAPQLFPMVLEYQIALVAGVMLLPRLGPKGNGNTRAWDLAAPALFAAAVGVFFIAPGFFKEWLTDMPTLWAASACFALIFIGRPVRLGLAMASVFGFAVLLPYLTGDQLAQMRNFFGIKHVERSLSFHKFFHGDTIHGTQNTLYGMEREPLTYYSKSGPLGDLIGRLGRRMDRAHVAAIGLGVGTVACYATPGQTWTFYEIDPQVVAIAEDPRYFRYLSSCLPHPNVVLGDARLTLSAGQRHDHELLILDAYTSDQVPVHLLTQEAFQIYLNSLTLHGVLAFDITNRYFDLQPVLGNLAAANGLTAYERHDFRMNDAVRPPGWAPSQWVVIARDPSDLGGIASDAHWHTVPPDYSLPLWTDDYTSQIRVWRRGSLPG